MSDIVRFGTNAPPVSGLNPESQGGANFLVAAGYTVLTLAAYVNEMLGKRLKVHFSLWGDQSNAIDPEAPQIRVLIHTSPDIWGVAENTLLRCRVVLSAARVDSGAQPDPIVYVEIRSLTEGSDTAGTAAPIQHNTRRDVDVGVFNLHYADFEVALELGAGPLFGRDETFELRIGTADLCQIVSCTIFEVPPRTLNPPTGSGEGDTVAPTNEFFGGGPIYDTPLTDLYAALTKIYDRQGSVFIAWAAMDTSKAAVVTAASMTNLWDATTAWDAGAFGFYCWPHRQGTLGNDDVDVVIWAILNPGADGSSDQIIGALEWLTQFAPIGRLDIQQYVPPVGVDPAICAIALQTTWPGGSALTSALVEILGRYDGGGAGMTVYSCGMYAKVALDPRTLDGLVLWLRADDLGLADTDPVDAWTDASGEGNDAVQATGSKQPLYVADALSGRAAVRFDGVDDFLAVADDASFKTTTLTAYVVMRVTATSDPQAVIGYPHDVTHTSPFWRWGLVARTNPAWDLYNAATVVSVNIDFATRKLMRLWRYESNATTQELARDSAAAHTGASIAITYPNAVGLRIGADASGGSPLGADVAEILIFNRQLTYTERSHVEEMLSERYGLLRGEATA